MKEDQSTLVGFIKKRLRGQQASLAAMLLIGILLVLPGILVPVFSKIFIDDILLGGNISWLGTLLAVMLGTVLFQAVLTFYRNMLLQKVKNKMTMLSAYDFLFHLFRLPMGFFEQRYAGDIGERVESNDSVSSFLAGDLGEVFLNLLVSAFYLVLLLSYSPLLTLVGLASIAVYVVIMGSVSGKMGENMKMLFKDQGEMAGALLAGLNITQTLKALGAENEYVTRMLGYYAKVQRVEQENGKLQQSVNAIPQVCQQIAGVLVLVLGGLEVMKGDMTAGMLVAFTTLLPSFMGPMSSLVCFVGEIQELKADRERIEDIMGREKDPRFLRQEEGERAFGKLSGEVEVKELVFGYDKQGEPLLKHFSFSLESGDHIALVGSSGSGKSTASKLLAGLYQPWSGEILMDGRKLGQIPQSLLEASVATVSQDVTLFSGTVRENLTMWNTGILEEDMVRAAKDACIHEVITKKPGAYEYRLTEGGMNLSGGQRQRLGIARALAVNPSILLMDEATSALDPLLEKEIMENIKRRGCTCLIVAHRLSAIRDCGKILVMERGKIVQSGTHESLMREPGPYRDLVQGIS